MFFKCHEVRRRMPFLMNFREFVQFAVEIYDDDFGGEKPVQFNCSSCVEMDYYNIRRETGNLTSVLVSDDPICFDANDWSVSTEYVFNAPFDGTLAGVRLEYKSGYILCDH